MSKKEITKLNIREALIKFIVRIIRFPVLIKYYIQKFFEYCQYIFHDKWILFRYEKLLKQNKGADYNFLWSVACIYNKYEKYDKALKAIEMFLEKVPEEKIQTDDAYCRAYSLLAWCNHYTGNSEKSFKIYNDILKKNITDEHKMGCYLALSIIYRDNCDFENAYKWIFNGISLAEKKDLILSQLLTEISAIFFKEKNNRAREIMCIALALKKRRLTNKKNKNFAQTISEIAEETGRSEFFKIAIIFHNKLLNSKKFRPDKNFYYSIALAYYGVANKETAQNSEAWANYLSDDLKKSKKYVTLGLKFKPDIEKDYDYYWLMSNILARMEKYRQAITILEIILQNPVLNKKQTYYSLILNCYYQRSTEKTKNYLEKLLSLGIDDFDDEQKKVLERIQTEIK